MAVKDNLGGRTANEENSTITYYLAETDVEKNDALQMKQGIHKDYYIQYYQYGITSAFNKCFRVTDMIYIFQTITQPSSSSTQVSITYELKKLNPENLTFEDIDHISNQYDLGNLTYQNTGADFGKFVLIQISSTLFLELIDMRIVKVNSLGNSMRVRLIHIADNKLIPDNIYQYQFKSHGKTVIAYNDEPILYPDKVSDSISCIYNNLINYQVVNNSNVVLTYNLCFSSNNVTYFDTAVLLLKIHDDIVEVTDEKLPGFGGLTYRSDNKTIAGVSAYTAGIIKPTRNAERYSMLIGIDYYRYYLYSFKITNDKIIPLKYLKLPSGICTASQSYAHIRTYNLTTSNGYPSSVSTQPPYAIDGGDFIFIIGNREHYTTTDVNFGYIQGDTQAFLGLGMNLVYDDASQTYLVGVSQKILVNRYGNHIIDFSGNDDTINLASWALGYKSESGGGDTKYGGFCGLYLISKNSISPLYPDSAMTILDNSSETSYGYRPRQFNLIDILPLKPIAAGHRNLCIPAGCLNNNNGDKRFFSGTTMDIIQSNAKIPIQHTAYNNHYNYATGNSLASDIVSRNNIFTEIVDFSTPVYSDHKSSIYGTYASDAIRYPYSIIFYKLFDPLSVRSIGRTHNYNMNLYAPVIGIAMSSAKAGEYVKVMEIIR